MFNMYKLCDISYYFGILIIIFSYIYIILTGTIDDQDTKRFHLNLVLYLLLVCGWIKKYIITKNK